MREQHRIIARSFLSAGLLAAVLALIAGVLGMHIVAGPHSLHAAAPPTTTMSDGALPGHAGAPLHANHPSPDSAQPADEGAGTTARAVCSCPGNCPAGHVMAGSCVPSAATATLAAPIPDRSPVVPSAFQIAAADGLPPWSYLPRSPSPGELSISRT